MSVITRLFAAFEAPSELPNFVTTDEGPVVVEVDNEFYDGPSSRYAITLPSGVVLLVDDHSKGAASALGEHAADVWVIPSEGKEVSVGIGDTPADGFASFYFHGDE
jgi:hypothetical protein